MDGSCWMAVSCMVAVSSISSICTVIVWISLLSSVMAVASVALISSATECKSCMFSGAQGLSATAGCGREWFLPEAGGAHHVHVGPI